MPPEAIKDTSSQTGKARSKVCYFRFYWFDRVTNQTENATVGKTPSANFVQQISPKGDVWSLGCILYCMTYGKTPFQSITNQISKLHAIIDPSHKIEFPDISEKDLLDVLKVKRCHRWDFCVTVLHTLKWESVQSIVDESLLEVLLRSCKIKIFSFCFVCFLFFSFYQRCLVRNPRERIAIAELLEHPYLQLKPQASPEHGTCTSISNKFVY